MWLFPNYFWIPCSCSCCALGLWCFCMDAAVCDVAIMRSFTSCSVCCCWLQSWAQWQYMRHTPTAHCNTSSESMNVLFVCSPFMTNVEPAVTTESPAAKVHCYGTGVQTSGVRKGQKAVFTVDATQATVTDQPVEVTTTNINTGQYSCSPSHVLSTVCVHCVLSRSSSSITLLTK